MSATAIMEDATMSVKTAREALLARALMDTNCQIMAKLVTVSLLKGDSTHSVICLAALYYRDVLLRWLVGLPLGL